MVTDNPETFADLNGHGTADWLLPDEIDYNTSQSADFRCAGGPSATCGTSPVAARSIYFDGRPKPDAKSEFSVDRTWLTSKAQK